LAKRFGIQIDHSYWRCGLRQSPRLRPVHRDVSEITRSRADDSVSSHFADPALLGILSASLTPYNNDLYLSNLAHVPCIALHGGADGNVPPRHSRIYASTINSWSKDKDAVEVVEVEGKDHWWDGILNHPRVSDFIRGVIGTKRRSFGDERRKGFTLTTACVEETGYKAGTRVVELETPGK